MTQEPRDQTKRFLKTSSSPINLNQRELLGELMDDPTLPERDHALALRGLQRVNTVLRTAPMLFRQLLRLMGDDPSQPRRVLDVACGDGDTTVLLAKLALKHGLPWQVSGCDISERAVSFAKANASRRRVDTTYFQADALNDLDVQGYDAVVNSLFLHHLEDDQITCLLRRLRDARHVVISDLVRSKRAYATTWLGIRLLSRSYVTHVDGPLSVRAALTKEELCEQVRQAGLVGATVQSTWSMRQLLVWSRPS